MISAVILAGGSSKRMGDGVDKLMLYIANLPLLAHTLFAFERCKDIDEIVLVAREDRKTAYQTVAVENGIHKLAFIASGGIERQDSVWCGLQKVSSQCDIVLIHDCARALITSDIISCCIAAARQTGAAIPASRIKDTIKRTAPDAVSFRHKNFLQIEATVDRSHLWAAQTPQTFRMDLIRKAYEPLIRDQVIVTDDAAAVERLGYPVALVESDPFNFKITTPEDLLLAEVVLSKRSSLFHV